MKKTDTAIRLLTLAEAASILKISKRTLHRMIQQKQIPAFKVGGQWRILESRFQEWVQEEEAPLPSLTRLPRKTHDLKVKSFTFQVNRLQLRIFSRPNFFTAFSKYDSALFYGQRISLFRSDKAVSLPVLQYALLHLFGPEVLKACLNRD